MSFLSEFGENLRNARNAQGMTQRELAQQIGITANCISMYESGRRMPNIETVSLMSDVLNISLEDLVPHSDKMLCTDVYTGQTMIFDLLEEE